MCGSGNPGGQGFMPCSDVRHKERELDLLTESYAACQAELAAMRERAEAAERRERHLLTVIEDAVSVGEMEGRDFRLMPWSTLMEASALAAAPPAPSADSRADAAPAEGA